VIAARAQVHRRRELPGVQAGQPAGALPQPAHLIGMILIGIPGIEKRLARYPQLFSRIGFVHEYRTLSADELLFVLQHYWSKLSLTLSADDFTDTEAIAAVARVTGGNFRLVQRLFAQIRRIMEINNLSTITREVIETARESLVIGSL